MAHPVPIRDILLLSSSSTQKTPAYDHFSSFCGRGVFTTDDDDWTIKRHAVVAALFRRNGRNTGSFVEGLEDVCHVTATRLIRTILRRQCIRPEENVNQNRNHHHHHNTTNTTMQQQPNTTLNIVPLLQRATIGLIYRYLTHASAEQAGATEENTETTKSHTTTRTKDYDTANEGFLQEYLQAITNIRLNLLAQSRSLAYLLLPRWVYQHGGSRLYTMEQRDLLPAIRSLAHSACRQAQPQSPLYQLLQNPIYSQPSTTVTKHDEPHMDTTDSTKSTSKTTASSLCFSKNIIDETITLLFAGQDTTAATLSWTLHLLTLYPQVQETLYREITAHILDHDHTSDHNNITIRKKDVSQMPYLDAVIKESMRLYPVAPFIVRNIGGHGGGGGSTTDPDNTKESKVFPRPLPDNTLACIWIYSLHRHPTYWSRPDEFIPERWLVHLQPTAPQPNSSSTNSTSDTTTNMPDLGIRTPCAYIPYATGARNCLGQPMANLILRILLCRLMISFEFSDERVVQLQQQQQQRPQNGDDDENDTTTASQQPLSHEQILPLHKEMQAGFTILPLGGLELVIKERHRPSMKHPQRT